MKSWYSIKALAQGHAEIVIYDEIGFWGITAADFIRELNALQAVDNITLRVNSPGGDVFDGNAIYNLLRAHPATVTAHIDGVAASIASLIVMAADEIVMPANAMLMIHDPFAGVSGNADDLRKAADLLDKLRQGLAAAYIAKSGASTETVNQWMGDETWFTAAEAVDAGLADTLAEAVTASANFDLTQFRNAPSAPPRIPAPAGTTAQQENTAMNIDELKAQLKQAGDNATALQYKLDLATSELTTVQAKASEAQAKLDESAPLIEAGREYQKALVDQVMACRRTLQMVGDKPEEVEAATSFVASWPLEQIKTEAERLQTVTARSQKGQFLTPPSASVETGDEPTTFRSQKED